MDKLLFEELTSSPEETEALGRRLAQMLEEHPDMPSFIALDGDLGTGKTEFTRGFVSLLSPGSSVKSPTYALCNEYGRGKRKIYHFDVYRIKDDDDLYSTGFYDYPENAVYLIEWASVINYALPDRRINVSLEKTSEGENMRRIKVTLTDI